jgi:dihydrofolate reductase
MTMATIRLYMAMSLDGFVCGPDDRPGQELGQGGGRLFNWLDEREGEGVDGQVYGEAQATGAVITGRRTFELAGRWNGDHHDGVAIHVLTHDPEDDAGNVHWHRSAAACAGAARADAGDGAVLVHGAAAAQALLRAGELDEVEVHLVPVLLTAGRRLFEDIGPDRFDLELVRRLQGHDALHLRYAVRGTSPLA